MKDAIVGGILLTLFLICLFTGGYPYYVYYGIFLFIPYLLTFLAKPLRQRLFGPYTINWRRAFATFILAGGAALLICAPYLVGIKHLMVEIIDRAGKDFDYSTSHIFNFEDTLGSLVYPPAASVEEWYFFSIAGLLMILLYMFMGKTVNYKDKGKGLGKETPRRQRNGYGTAFWNFQIGSACAGPTPSKVLLSAGTYLSKSIGFGHNNSMANAKGHPARGRPPWDFREST